MRTNKLERRYNLVKKELQSLLSKMRSLSTREIERLEELEAAMFELERWLLEDRLLYAN